MYRLTTYVKAPISTLSEAGLVATILILEDEVGVRDLFALLLTQDGYTVLEAGTVREAEQLSGSRRIDLLIADLVLPGGKSGTDFAVGLIECQPNVRVLFMSGWLVNREDDTDNIAKLPGRLYRILQKPFGIDELVRHVHILLHNVKWRTA